MINQKAFSTAVNLTAIKLTTITMFLNLDNFH